MLDDAWFDEGAAAFSPRSTGAATHRRAIYVGRLLAWKGVHLALEVMRRPEASEWELHVFGSGPERRAMDAEVRCWRLADRVTFHGAVTRDDVRVAMAGADALLYPSMREAAGWVVAEALGVGCPVVCLDTAGPPLLLRGAGRAVTPGWGVVEELARALAASTGDARTVVRWGEDRVPALLDAWYCRATEGLAGKPGRVP
jgi:glycosyltransferase involved in cell wall biosynthesis